MEKCKTLTFLRIAVRVPILGTGSQAVLEEGGRALTVFIS